MNYMIFSFFPFWFYMWFFWNCKSCWAKIWSSVRALKFLPYWCDLDFKIIALNGYCRLSIYGVECLVLFLVLGVDLLWAGGMADNGLGVLTYLCTLLGVVGCVTGTLWNGTGGDTGGTGTLWASTEREICVIVDVGVATGITVVGFFVARPRISAIIISIFLVLLPYSSYGTTNGVIFRMARMSVADSFR